MLVKGRFKFTQFRRLCMNCFNSQHKTAECNSNYTCRYCSLKHHSLLHLEKRKPLISPAINQEQSRIMSLTMITLTIDDSLKASVKFSGTASTSSTIVLDTALI